MRLEDLIDEALRHPTSPGFALGKALTEAFPAKHLIEGTGKLDLRGFTSEGHCSVELHPGLYHQFDSYWSQSHGVYRIPECAWQLVEWGASSIDVLTLRWPGEMRDVERHFVVAPNPERGEAFYAAVQAWNHEVRGEVLVFSEGCFSKNEKLFESIRQANFGQLVLEGALKEQLREDFTQFLASRALYEEAGVPWRRGALLLGPPGNGKTLCVKALVHELEIPCLYIHSFESKYGTPQRAIETVFQRAREQAPCMIVLEDIDALLPPTSRSLFLNELDGFAQNAGVITLATTNHPERLDPSIVERPSRFDRKYYFELPTGETRARYIASWNGRLRPQLALGDDAVAELASRTEGFSFAYVQEVFVSASMRWMHKREGTLLPFALEQVELLRAQMTRA